MSRISDSFQRPINYLRVSVTDRCNLHCIYCNPHKERTLLPRQDILSYEEIIRIVSAAVELGITRIRLTGGEPTVRDGIANLVEMISEIENVDDISLTTNGLLLSKFAAQLKRAGLKRVNISLDTLSREKYRQITGQDNFDAVIEGIMAAKTCKLTPVKINMVVMRSINDDEILSFARKTIDDDWNVRFIELMPNGCAENSTCSFHSPCSTFISAGEIKQKIEVLGVLEPSFTTSGNGPAKYFKLPGSRGTIGFITPITEHFCFGCNRLRLTSDGKLLPCLMSDEEVNTREMLRANCSKEQLKGLICEAIARKPRGHRLIEGISPRLRTMSQVGG